MAAITTDTPRLSAAFNPASHETHVVSLSGGHQYPPSPSGTLPPYPTTSNPSFPSAVDEKSPQYEEPEEGWTLARMLFFAGFILPLFWIFGGLFLFSDLKAVPGYEEELGDVNQQKIKLAMLKETENKWSWRCVWAFSGLAVFLTITLVALHSSMVI
ncbi:hypothetical protein BOTBODRAFT_35547 [Botryobasidium botryosum FD-172 SS1]|uniref:Uncharacterized protein n=1 Tax=Botryobasidium botryosum (strain FD-172 SS1) TaxID=930990 RepID=A0A067M654_BOTB1|nr:hypothetical protein BOTBODRAFT_35547 [Botryobasidium botryosum FD-172 SS1]